MSLFNKNKGRKLTKKDVYSNMAEEIVMQLGSTMISHEEGTFYRDMVYDNNGIKIVLFDEKRNLKNRLRVSNYQFEVLSEKRFLEGSWKETLKKIYCNLPELKKEKESQPGDWKKVLYDLKLLTSLLNTDIIMISKELRIYKNESHLRMENYRFDGDVYQVYDRNCNVYEAGYDKSTGLGCYGEYVPGFWEKELQTYLNQLMQVQSNEDSYKKVKTRQN